MVSKDVEFKDLGLLIIDEEQKFGVKVKDRLKELKVNVDVLTLTATPIPRTLHFSLMGARYNVEKWFYWESIFWFDDNKGGKGGPDGLDPFVVSENFHNQHGDYAQGDGLLVYPSTQKPNGFTDLGRDGWSVKSDVIPSVRLKSLRRGQQDRALIEIARLSSPIATENVVLQMVPNALGEARIYPSWTENGGDYVSARHTLRRLALGKTESFQRAEKVREEGRSGGLAVPSRLGTIAKYVSVIMMIALIYLMVRGLKK